MRIFGYNIEKRSSETSNLSSNTNNEATGFALTYYNRYGTYMSETLSSVYAAVELISNSIAQLPIHIKDKSGNIIEHPLNDVFSNGLLSKFMLMKQLVKDMLISGNGIAYILRDEMGAPIELIYCPKSKYTIQYNENTRTLYYQIPTCSNKNISPKDVIHLYKNTFDGVNGKGLSVYASRTLENANNTEDAANGYFESGCSVNGILKSSKHLSKKQQADIQAAWNTAHNNSTSKNNIAVMPVDLDYIQLSNNAAEAQLLESRLYNVQEVARYFNINPVLLGDLSHSSYSTIEAAQLEFVIHTLAPYIELIQDELNRKLCHGDNIRIDIDEDHILRADKSSTATYLSTLTSSGIITINEARHQLGLEKMEGADDLIIPYTDINTNKVNKDVDDTDKNIETQDD